MNPFLDPNHPLDVVDGKLIYTKDITVRPKATAPPIPTAKDTTVAGSYNSLQIEKSSPLDKEKTDKALFTFDASLKRLNAAGYERHLRHTEAFPFIFDSLEEKLSGKQQAIAENMLESYGEWFSLAVLTEKEKVTFYLDPENITWNGNAYIVNTQLKHAPGTASEFALNSIKTNAYTDIKTLNTLNPALVEYLWTRPFAKLPEEVQENAGLWLPAPSTEFRPVGRGNYVSRYVIYTNFNGWASRGARKNFQRKQGLILNE